MFRLWIPNRCTTSISTCCTNSASSASRCVWGGETVSARERNGCSCLKVCVCLQVTDAYSEFDAGRVIRTLQAFLTRDLSSFYFSIIKDRYNTIKYHTQSSCAAKALLCCSHSVLLHVSIHQVVLWARGLVGPKIVSDGFRGNSGRSDQSHSSHPATPGWRGLSTCTRTRPYVPVALCY